MVREETDGAVDGPVGGDCWLVGAVDGGGDCWSVGDVDRAAEVGISAADAAGAELPPPECPAGAAGAVLLPLEPPPLIP